MFAHLRKYATDSIPLPEHHGTGSRFECLKYSRPAWIRRCPRSVVAFLAAQFCRIFAPVKSSSPDAFARTLVPLIVISPFFFRMIDA
jgi:hypothetical protein